MSIQINVRENHNGYLEWTINRHGKLWAHDTTKTNKTKTQKDGQTRTPPTKC